MSWNSDSYFILVVLCIVGVKIREVDLVNGKMYFLMSLVTSSILLIHHMMLMYV